MKSKASPAPGKITIRGARQHNLKNLSLEIDQNALTVITGVSGSGKSSLAFDTLYAEGMRRFVESQSTYARQFLERLDKPDVDAIDGLCPTIAVQAKNTVKTSRSTVGTSTEIYDYLRLIFAKAGDLHCPRCGIPVKASTLDEMIEGVLSYFEGSRICLLAPLPVSEKITPPLVRDLVRARGFSYILAGELIDLETASDEELAAALEPIIKSPPTGADAPAGIHIVVDRLNAEPRRRARIGDSIETALKESGGTCTARNEEGRSLTLSEIPRCEKCGGEVHRPTPQHLSFNNPLGACPECTGFGDRYELNMDAVIPDHGKSLREGAIEPWNSSGIRYHVRRHFRKSAEEIGVRPDVPYRDLTDEEKDIILHGSDTFYGILPFFEKMKRKSYKPSNRFFLQRYRTLRRCSACGGSRLNPAALSVRLGGMTTANACAMPLHRFLEFFESLDLPPEHRQMVDVVLKEIKSRARYLLDVGLGYLTLDRLSRTLSGGEMQRVHLATYLSSRLTGTLYILDEPTVGLHPRDTDRLLAILRDLRNLGNAVIVVEHDPQVIRAADHVLDLGPGAGENGGAIVYNGTFKNFKLSKDSLTAAFIRGDRSVGDELPPRRRDRPTEFLTVRGAAENNLKNINVRFPANRFTVVSGVSGSGKSSLVCDVLYPFVAKKKGQRVDRAGACETVRGWEKFSSVEMVGQDPIGRTPRANPATFIQVLTPIRTLFAGTTDAKERGLEVGAFSFNTSDGQCPYCQGAGFIEVDMQFLADIYVTCENCGGKRYRPEVLEVRYKGLSISDVLDLTATEAAAFFRDHRQIVKRLRVLLEVGMGYIRLGQPLNTLSGGECQRLKIASELIDARRGSRLYLFDEPTMGLHPDEIGKFLGCVNRLVAEGHTVIVIEHNLDVIAHSDHVIDLGPEGGEDGGYIVAEGPPEKIAASPKSHTGRYLAEMLKKK
ncbi:MAG: excinuclease ABC subunit UvrA [bacterium]